MFEMEPKSDPELSAPQPVPLWGLSCTELIKLPPNPEGPGSHKG